jgi:hypothetical protein
MTAHLSLKSLMNTKFRGVDEAQPMGEDATLPIARRVSRPAALLRLAGNALPRKATLRAWPDNSPAAHLAAFNCGF